jgi:hypothetical protein
MPDTAGLGDLWIRASRLEERCTMTIHVVALPPGWKVRISPLRAPDVRAEGAGEHIIEALAAAINRAELMGMAPPGGSGYIAGH